jgi:WhiB family redox-sensing transcriptional regulator
MSAIEIDPTERYRIHGQDPADIATSVHAAAEYVNTLIASLRAPWMRDALCAEFDLALWFPSRGQSNQPALEICARCSVRLECLAEAIADPELDHGIRGGATANARQVMRRNRLNGQSSIHKPAACHCGKCDTSHARKQRRADYTRRWRRTTGRTGPT